MAFTVRAQVDWAGLYLSVLSSILYHISSHVTEIHRKTRLALVEDLHEPVISVVSEVVGNKYGDAVSLRSGYIRDFLERSLFAPSEHLSLISGQQDLILFLEDYSRQAQHYGEILDFRANTYSEFELVFPEIRRWLLEIHVLEKSIPTFKGKEVRKDLADNFVELSRKLKDFDTRLQFLLPENPELFLKTVVQEFFKNHALKWRP